jgi:hypothetical protein
MTRAQRLAKSHFFNYQIFRNDGGSHAKYMMNNDIDQDSETARLLDEMYDPLGDKSRDRFYKQYPFMRPQTRKLVPIIRK